jgi:hypothetical protein
VQNNPRPNPIFNKHFVAWHENPEKNGENIAFGKQK